VHPSNFDTEELNEMRLFSLSAGGKGLSQKARAEYYNTPVRVERAAMRAQRAAEGAALRKLMDNLAGEESDNPDAEALHSGDKAEPPASAGSRTLASGSTNVPHAVRPKKKTSPRKRIMAAALKAQAELEAIVGPLETAFPTEATFLNSLKGETPRCLSEQGWKVSDIVDGDDIYKFYSRDVMLAALRAFMRATRRCMRGARKTPADGSIIRTGTLDSDLYLREQADVDRIHSGKMLNGKPLQVFTMATQFFSDATLVSKNGGM